MAGVDVNYFTCTLEQAVQRRLQAVDAAPSFRTVLELIDEQARLAPSSPAIGFANFTASRAPAPPLTFRQLHDLSVAAARELSSLVEPPDGGRENPTIGLLCASSLDFVLTWLGLMRLGWAILLLAPQLEARAAEHLCRVLDIRVVFTDSEERGGKINDGIRIVNIPSYHRCQASPRTSGRLHVAKRPRVPPIAYFCHTSGTSSGLPKPIAQMHFGVVGALPRFCQRHEPATFSTTPLYHGGLADCLRAWTSGALIWLFPEGLAPVTTANLLEAVRYARSRCAVPIRYFSSVPYVAQRLAEEDAGIKLLRSMDLVGVGGAAVPAAVGDRLIDAGVNLLSRFGSAECGFVMSSHRDYARDREWQYLRPLGGPGLLAFEPRGDGLSELVVKPGWPSMVKTNRGDGSYATSDLFEPHCSRPNSWRYHSRADAQITLVNGKKFDPSPLEAAISASTPLVRDVLIFGAGHDYPGILLFTTRSDLPPRDVTNSVWPEIDRLNAGSQSHARITKSMLVVVPVRDDQAPLDKSSKGAVLRRQAEERYAGAIAAAYEKEMPIPSTSTQVGDDQLPKAVLECFSHVLGRELDPHDDVYRQGVDSIACIQIRNHLQSSLLPPGRRHLPANIVYDQGTAEKLTQYLRRVRNGALDPCAAEQETTEMSSAQCLVDKYSSFRDHGPGTRRKHGSVVVLTGATGFLGAHILHQLLRNSTIARIYCLVRARSQRQAQDRVSQSLQDRGLPEMERGDGAVQTSDRVVCLPCDLASKTLGLSEEDRQGVLHEATVFIHSAWAVNFNIRLESFEDQIAGTRSLIEAAAESCAPLFFISSTAAVSRTASPTVFETVSEDISDASPLGYAQSKWVAERVCAAANDRFSRAASSPDPARPGRVSIIRVGQLCGDEAGVWNASEAYPLLLSTAAIAGCLPSIAGEALDWMPVELAARSVLEIVSAGRAGTRLNGSDSRSYEDGEPDGGPSAQTRVYHVLNPHKSPTWEHMLHWLSADPGGRPFQVVSPATWLARLEAALDGRKPSHPSEALLGLWRDKFGQEPDGKAAAGATRVPVFSVALAQDVSPTMRGLKPLGRQRLAEMWKWVCGNVG